MSIDGSYNFRRVSDQITTSGVVGAERLAGLRAEGYDAVVNLLPDSSEYAVRDEAAILRAQGVDYVYLPVDFAAPARDDLEAFIDAMSGRAGQKIHVHCAANFRVSAFYSLYAVYEGRWTTDEAEDFIASVWDPTEHPAWKEFLAAERARVGRGPDS